MKTINTLKEGDYIAFKWRYSQSDKFRIEVAPITILRDNQATVHFMFGYEPIAENINTEDILAIGDSQGTAIFKGWNGTFTIIKATEFVEQNIKLQL